MSGTVISIVAGAIIAFFIAKRTKTLVLMLKTNQNIA
jgi:uncharacterized protein YneF (UPF0154 family)